jgi:hypothetical protein
MIACFGGVTNFVGITRHVLQMQLVGANTLAIPISRVSATSEVRKTGEDSVLGNISTHILTERCLGSNHRGKHWSPKCSQELVGKVFILPSLSREIAGDMWQ